ncbi:hypothetical protein CIRG_04913 [Coccidioides immitis RMSCC 2394]|uniref:Uncharacterized protein n=1 Tax=Coccidioides immitis RMSCC 2394 TaxID=404692 RepID=A0A0J7B5R0_COCIT|nr:hypothetical protein CIRG_04913 [Coccidioides immitis RMSCC 2394]
MANRAFRAPIRLLSLFFASILLYYCLRSFLISSTSPSISSSDLLFKHLVVASLKSDNTSWVGEHLPDWQAKVYVADDPKAQLTVPLNKGRESMVYLTYIIDHYNHLPDYMVFIHGLRYQWHNDDPIYDGVPILRNLRLPYVKSVGYAPLRCTWVPGCPAELHPLNPTEKGLPTRVAAERAYASAFKTLLPNESVPKEVGATCSSQFAVTRERVRRRRKSDYERMRRWLMNTDLEDEISGRIMEYAWHIIMGMSPVYCPPAGECYCITFGICKLNCNAARCDKRYVLPTYAQIPNGWPEHGGGENGWPTPGWNE